MWDIPISHGNKVLALTVPDSGNTPEGINIKRNRLNELILEHEQDGL